MSPRKAAVLREGGGPQSLREHLIATMARLIAERRTANVTVRDIAREAKVADGVLYNHFADKEELIAQGLHVHILTVVEQTVGGLPRQAGRGTVEDNLHAYVTHGLELLTAILPLFAGLLTQPKILTRFAEFSADNARGAALRRVLADYLRAEQRLGRIAASSNADAVATMIIGACHDLVLPHLLHSPPPAEIDVPPGFVDDLISTIWRGIAPHAAHPSP
jgi:AcrR family transcriptional regulator